MTTQFLAGTQAYSLHAPSSEMHTTRAPTYVYIKKIILKITCQRVSPMYFLLRPPKLNLQKFSQVALWSESWFR